jgi:Zn finger protein HypA/HybF involved in hydrogenase expression
MHELSVVNNLIKVLDRICKENNAKKVLKINIRVNPYSCLDEENLNFIFLSIVKEKEIYRDAKIEIKKTLNPEEREYVVENIEIEV